MVSSSSVYTRQLMTPRRATTITTVDRASDIFEDTQERIKSMLAVEGEYQAHPNYIRDVQVNGMTVEWRKKVNVWAFQVGETFDLDANTTHSTINFMDRYLSLVSVDKKDMQLLSLAALLVATKMHEMESFSIADSLVDTGFSMESIEKQEKKLLSVLGWRLNPPTALRIVDELCVLLDDSSVLEQVRRQTVVFLGHAALDYRLSTAFSPSELGLGALAASFVHFRLDYSRFADLASLCGVKHTTSVRLLATQFLTELKLISGDGAQKLQNAFVMDEDVSARVVDCISVEGDEENHKKGGVSSNYDSPRSVVSPVFNFSPTGIHGLSHHDQKRGRIDAGVWQGAGDALYQYERHPNGGVSVSQEVLGGSYATQDYFGGGRDVPSIPGMLHHHQRGALRTSF